MTDRGATGIRSLLKWVREWTDNHDARSDEIALTEEHDGRFGDTLSTGHRDQLLALEKRLAAG